MERDTLDDFIDEMATYIEQRIGRRDGTTLENTRDRVRIALCKFLKERDDHLTAIS